MKTNVEQKGTSAKEIEQMIKLERVTKEQAATYLGVSTTSVQNYVKQGKLNPIKLGDKKQSKVFFKLDEILAMLGITDKQAFLNSLKTNQA